MPHRPEGTLQNVIRVTRAARNRMTQEELAQKAKVTRQTIIAIESGRYVPSLILALRISHALGEPVETLFQLVDE